jgi:hypothetical protein
LALNAVHRLYELCSCIWRRIRNNDDPQAIALAPKDIHAIWHIGTCRLKQCLVKYFLRDAVSLHAGLRVPAYCNVPKPWYVAIEVFHGHGQFLTGRGRELVVHCEPPSQPLLQFDRSTLPREQFCSMAQPGRAKMSAIRPLSGGGSPRFVFL